MLKNIELLVKAQCFLTTLRNIKLILTKTTKAKYLYLVNNTSKNIACPLPYIPLS